MWYYLVKEIVRYHDKLVISHPRVSFDERAARIGNASILLSNMKIEDEGIYSCLVIYSLERVEADIILDVLVPPKIQVSSKEVSEEKEKTLICSVNGFYPGDITITWLRDGEVLQNSSLGKKQRNEDHTYGVTSMVNVTSGRELETVSCRVQHESLLEPLQEDFQLVYREETRRIPVIIGVCCAAALLVAAVGIGLFIWKRKPRKKGGFTLSDIDGPDKLIDGEVVTLSCTGDHWAKKTRVTWLEERAGGDPEIIQSHGGDPEEAERLLNTSYDMDTKHMGSQRWSSNLRFIFHVANHKGVTFICRFTSRKKKQEKRFHCNEVYGKNMCFINITVNHILTITRLLH
uniref:Ig-like domain-containing protein n=1 Tax=Leptobrachium leishanense TaxID=445787 RepID=A0A8C5QY67_9ANUR